MSTPSPIQGKATVSNTSAKPHVSKSAWTVDKVAKTTTAEYLGGTLVISRRVDGSLAGEYSREMTEADGAQKEAPIHMTFNMPHIETVLEAQDHAETVVRDNLARIYPKAIESEDAKALAARQADAGDEPF